MKKEDIEMDTPVTSIKKKSCKFIVMTNYNESQKKELDDVTNLDKNKKIIGIRKCDYQNCGKKLTIVEGNIKCKCGFYFCKKHTNSFDHECGYDYRTEEKIRLNDRLEKIIGEKLNKI